MKGFIYCLKSSNTNDIYIGSSFSTPDKRLAIHKSHYKMFLRGERTYYTAIEILQYTDVEIEILYEGEFDNKKELLKKEGELIKNNNCVNVVIPQGITKEESLKKYNAKNETKERMKTYYLKNREHILERQRELITCECGKTLTKTHLKRHKKSKHHLNFSN